jgi:hypothetical protein
MFVVICPYCNEYVWIEQINCGIFRHGIYKQNFEQIQPHASELECKRLVSEQLIYGCGQPFRVIIQLSGIPIAEVCDWI